MENSERSLRGLRTPQPKTKKSGSFTTTFDAYQSPTASLLKQQTFNEHDGEQALASVVAAKVIGHHMRKHVQHYTDAHCKVRSEHGAITWRGYEESKTSAKQRRSAKTNGHFTPANRPYAPIGGSLEPAKKTLQDRSSEAVVAASIGKEVVLSEKEQLFSSPVVPLNEPAGLFVEIPSYGSTFLQVRLSDVDEVLNGRKIKLPLSLVIKMVDVKGNPDMYIVTDRTFNKLGIPSKERNVWKTKTHVEILPLDPNYTLGSYLMRVSCGVDETKFRVVATSHRHIPTIDKALMGPGFGYRLSEKEKRDDIGRRMISKAVLQSDQRRRKGSSGNFPMSQVPLPSYFRPKSETPTPAPILGFLPLSAVPKIERQPTKTEMAAIVRQATLARSLSRLNLDPNKSRSLLDQSDRSMSRRGVDESDRSMSRRQMDESGRPATALGLPSQNASQASFDVSMERPQSALERAVDAAFRTTMDKLKYDYSNLEVQEIRVHDFFSILKPKKIEFAHLNQNQKQQALLFGEEKSDLHDSEGSSQGDSPRDVDPTAVQGRVRGGVGRKGRRMGGFKEELMALFRSTEPITRKLREYEFVQLSIPVSVVSGYAVVADEGPGNRKLVYRREGRAEEVKPGQAMTVAAGGQVPDGADAVVEAKNVTKLRVTDTTNLSDRSQRPIVVSDLPIAGQNIRSEHRPYFVGGGMYIHARDYCQIRYPHLLGEYDTLFRSFFGAAKETSEGDQGGKTQADAARDMVQEEVAQVVLMGLDASPSKLLQAMKAKERKQLAQNCKVHVVHSRTVLVTQDFNEFAHGVQARSMYLLISGEMGVYLEDDGSAQDYTDSSWDFFADMDRVRRRYLGSDSAYGALFGERQLLFADPWPCTLIGMTTCKVAEIPLSALTEVIFARPDILNGLLWRRREEGFMSSHNHSTLLTIMREVEKAGAQDRASPDAGRQAEEQQAEQQSAQSGSLSEPRETELRTMMRLDSSVMKEAMARKEYDKEMDELIAEKALNEEQLALVLAERKEQEAKERARLKPVERGARGDAVSRILSAGAASSSRPPS